MVFVVCENATTDKRKNSELKMVFMMKRLRT